MKNTNSLSAPINSSGEQVCVLDGCLVRVKYKDCPDKVSARDRDAIQEIQRDAVDGKFDILLVFMFDRLGRRDDETPFVVEWFVRNGIEVWSATEGQQRFDTHVDKLMNYICCWQASGESIKTSIRVKTRLSPMTEAGRYTCGSVMIHFLDIGSGQV